MTAARCKVCQNSHDGLRFVWCTNCGEFTCTDCWIVDLEYDLNGDMNGLCLSCRDYVDSDGDEIPELEN